MDTAGIIMLVLILTFVFLLFYFVPVGMWIQGVVSLGVGRITIIDLITLSKLEKSKSEIRRLIKGNAIKLDDKIISNEKFIITNELFQNDYLKLSIGKKRHIKIELN